MGSFWFLLLSKLIQRSSFKTFIPAMPWNLPTQSFTFASFDLCLNSISTEKLSLPPLLKLAYLYEKWLGFAYWYVSSLRAETVCSLQLCPTAWNSAWHVIGALYLLREGPRCVLGPLGNSERPQGWGEGKATGDEDGKASGAVQSLKPAEIPAQKLTITLWSGLTPRDPKPTLLAYVNCRRSSPS